MPEAIICDIIHVHVQVHAHVHVDHVLPQIGERTCTVKQEVHGSKFFSNTTHSRACTVCSTVQPYKYMYNVY